jgi:hypothetical protein
MYETKTDVRSCMLILYSMPVDARRSSFFRVAMIRNTHTCNFSERLFFENRKRNYLELGLIFFVRIYLSMPCNAHMRD